MLSAASLVAMQLTLQFAEVRVEIAVLQLASDLGLLRLCPAAPHRVDPLARLGRDRQEDARSLFEFCRAARIPARASRFLLTIRPVLAELPRSGTHRPRNPLIPRPLIAGQRQRRSGCVIADELDRAGAPPDRRRYLAADPGRNAAGRERRHGTVGVGGGDHGHHADAAC